MKPNEQQHSLWGHHRPLKQFKKAFIENKLHHAWLITGEEGVGKLTFVHHLIKMILSKTNTALSPINALSHPDILFIDRRMDEKKQRLHSEILVDDIRAVNEFLALTPAQGVWRIVLINHAEKMNLNATNSLLKILEEPPKASLLFLTCHCPENLLSTLKSRCQKLRLNPLSKHEMQHALHFFFPDLPQNTIDQLVDASYGSIGSALKILNSGYLELKEITDNFFARPDVNSNFFTIIDTIMQYENGFTLFLELISKKIYENTVLAIREARTEFGNPLHSIAEWIDRWKQILEWHNQTISFNLDKKQTLLCELNLISKP
ncbi:hypothetical protein COMNV_01368 [Commensalibacter sp. Nvir]|uniref:AAA family ATPase n=1 Tax=Commensalibacter sp. Nvir TaxID=3069817 RepID=UPI002D3771A4|nr:hypothetical protein COMNV_01368 [Commensalibacter sp. Nvir]